MKTPLKVVVQIAGVCLLTVFFAGSLGQIYLLTLHSMHMLAWNRYGFAELLINYDAGFIRRGLLGAWIRRLSGDKSELPAANIILFANFVLLTTTLTVMALRKGVYRVWNSVLVLAVPGGVFAMSVAREFFYRKEIFFCSALAVCGLALSLLRGIGPHGLRRFGAWCMICVLFGLAIVLSMVHEGFLFLYAPANLFLLIAVVRLLDEPQAGVESRSLEERLGWAYAGITVLAFLCMGYFHGSAQTSAVIWNRLNPADRAMMGPYELSAIGWMRHSMVQLLEEAASVIISGTMWFWLIPAGGLMLYSLALVAINREAGDGEHEISAGADVYRWAVCYLTLGLGSLPIFVLGRDWGRWIDSLNLSFLILWLSVPTVLLADFSPVWSSRAPLVKSLLERFRRLSKTYSGFVEAHKAWVVATMFFLAINFRFPETILEPSDPRYILYLGVHSIWKVLHHHAQG